MKKTKKNQRKRKRKSLILLLFLTIIMFGTATYAWFTANEVVTINDINVQVDASMVSKYLRMVLTGNQLLLIMILLLDIKLQVVM